MRGETPLHGAFGNYKEGEVLETFPEGTRAIVALFMMDVTRLDWKEPRILCDRDVPQLFRGLWHFPGLTLRGDEIPDIQGITHIQKYLNVPEEAFDSAIVEYYTREDTPPFAIMLYICAEDVRPVAPEKKYLKGWRRGISSS